jgi:hypothetical protein
VIYVSADPARHQLQTLATIGFPTPWIAEQIGMSATAINDLRTGETPRTGPYTIRAINRLYQSIADTTPAAHGIPERSAAITRLYAARHGWTAHGTAA